MKREKTIASVALNPELKSKLEQLAKLKGISLSMMIKIDLMFSLGFSDDFQDAIYKLANDLGISPSFVIEHLALAHWAEMAASEEVNGGPIPRALMEFIPGLTSRQFFDYWRDNKVKEIRYHLQGPNYISPAEAELLKYQKEGETVTYEELIRRKHNAEFEAEIATLPPDKQQKLRAARQRDELRQKEMRAKHE